MLQVRNVRLSFEDVPRHWFAGHLAATHLSNALGLLFPAGERFFIRSVRHYLPELERDPAFMAEIEAFFGQEGNHAREHQRMFSALEAQGFELRPFLELYERVMFERIEPLLPAWLRLSMTAACEHFTASLADNALRSEVFDEVHPQMRELLLWHAAEEIEHKAVAFDVLQRLHPSYAVRVAGLLFATATLLSWWLIGFRSLVAQEDCSSFEALRSLRSQASPKREQSPFEVIGSAFVAYLRPGFHPWKHDNADLAREFIQGMGVSVRGR